MKSFIISILQLTPESTYLSIPIGKTSSTASLNPFTTYNESLTQKENSQQELSFSMALYYDNQRNPFWDLILNNQYIRLTFLKEEKEEEIIDFIITKITPTTSSSNIIYSIAAQDLFSFQLSKQGMGLTYETEVPLQIDELVKDVLKNSNVYHWTVDPLLEKKLFTDFPDPLFRKDSFNYLTQKMKSSLSLSGSTCYNALVEIANIFNALIKPLYYKDRPGGVIYFLNKDRIDYKGYRLLPTVNLSSFTFNKDTSNFSSLMYVSGGETAEGAMVSIVPTMPQMLAEWLDMYTVYDELPSPVVHSYPFALVKEGDNYLLYESNIERGSLEGESIFLGLRKEYGKEEELKCSYSYRAEEIATEEEGFLKAKFEWAGGEKYLNFTITPGLSLDSKVLEIVDNFLEVPTGEVVIKILLRKTEIVEEEEVEIDTELAVSKGFIVKEKAWEELEGPLENFIPWEEKLNFFSIVDEVWKDPELADWKEKENNTYIDISNYCEMIEKNIKAAGEFIYDFNYFLENEMISPKNFEDLNLLFEKDLRNVNLKTQILSKQYNTMNYLLSQLIQKEEEYISMVAASFQQSFNYQKETPDPNLQISSELFSSQSGKLTENIEDLLNSEFKLNLPISEPSNVGELSETQSVQQDFYNQMTLAIQSLLSEIWTEKYFRLIFTVYGADYFQELRKTNREKAKEYTDRYFNYLDKYRKLINYTEGMSLEDEQNEVNKLTGEKEIECYEYIGKMEDLAYRADFYYNEKGQISRVKKVVKGGEEKNFPYLKLSYHSCYDFLIGKVILSNSTVYKKTLTSHLLGSKSIVERLESLSKQREKIWENLYKNYSPYIIESSYSDSTQLTSSGLYGAAIKQFVITNNPVINYSVSMIDYSSITDANYDTIQIGDKIKVYNDMLFQKKVKNVVIIQTKDKLPHTVFNSSSTALFNKDGSTPSIAIMKKERLANNLYKFTLEQDLPRYQFYFYNTIKIINTTNTGQEITILDYDYVADPVELQITGITKTLRDIDMQLTVLNNQTINSLVDKLLYSIRKA